MSMVLAIYNGILSLLRAAGFPPESHRKMIFSDLPLLYVKAYLCRFMLCGRNAAPNSVNTDETCNLFNNDRYLYICDR